MKKLRFLLPLLVSTLSITACEIFFKPEDVDPVIDPHEKATLKYTYTDYIENNTYDLDAAPNKGTAKLLIVPVWFNDSSNYIDPSYRDRIRADIQKAYFGSNEDTGWRSVKTYYEELSHNNLTLTGVVTDWYECGYNANCRSDSTNKIVENAVNWYKTTQGLSNLKDFDRDGNGHIDGVMLIYGAPDYITYNQTAPLGKRFNDNMWAYCFWLQNDDASVNNPTPNVFFWASYDFMYGSNSRVGSYFGGDTSYCNIDAHTYIHEMGHVFGLTDYYDYNNTTNPAGGFSMQDCNVGSHDPYSSMALGWSKPFIPNETTSYVINPFQSTGDLILLSDHAVDSPFDEYILLEMYTPTGLNDFDTQHKYANAYPTGTRQVGIRIWHVDARLLYSTSTRYSENKITTNPRIAGNRVTHMMSNTSYTDDATHISPLGPNYADYDLLHLIRNSITEDYKSKSEFASSALFKKGDTFTIDMFSKQFKNGKLDNNESFSWEVSIDDLKDYSASITVTRAVL